MLIKFLAHGAGSGRGAARYLLSENDHAGEKRASVKVLRGDPFMVGQLADSLDFKQRYTSGVLAFAPEDRPTDEQIGELIDDFERAAFAGLDKNRFAFSAILHEEDGGGKHVHIFSARVDLETGKSFNMAPPGWDSIFHPLRDKYNYKYGWARPDDPERARNVQPGKKAIIDASALRLGLETEPDSRALLSDFISQRVDAGIIKNRSDIIAALSEIGEITRNGKDYLSIKPHGFDKAIRLKGGYFGQEFKPEKHVDGENRGRQAGDGEGDRRRAESACQRFESAIESRANYNAKRYKIALENAPDRAGINGIDGEADHEPAPEVNRDQRSFAHGGDDHLVRDRRRGDAFMDTEGPIRDRNDHAKNERQPQIHSPNIKRLADVQNGGQADALPSCTVITKNNTTANVIHVRNTTDLQLDKMPAALYGETTVISNKKTTVKPINDNAVRIKNYDADRANASRQFEDFGNRVEAARAGFDRANASLGIALGRARTAFDRFVTGVNAMMNATEEQLNEYMHSLSADRYRVTVMNLVKNKAFILDKKDGVSLGFLPDELIAARSEMLKLQMRGENIYLTPLSKDRHHILVDDMDRIKFDKLIVDGYRPAVLIESSPGNFQSIFTIKKLGTEHDRVVANRISELLNTEYGDPKLSGSIHPHRAPGFENRKQKHQKIDGSYPEVRIVKSEKRECAKLFDLARTINNELELHAKSVKRSPGIDIISMAVSGEKPTNNAYLAHYQDIKNRLSGDLDLSRVDAMIAVRMRVTGHSQQDIKLTLLAHSKNIRHPDDAGGRDWSDYARRTAQFAFSQAGDIQYASMQKYASQWVRLESLKTALQKEEKTIRQERGMEL